MAYVIQSFVKRPRRYPWRQWADGRTWRVRPGVDFRCSINGFRSAAYRFAFRASLTVRISVKAKFVEFCFVDGPARDEPPKSSGQASPRNTSRDKTPRDKTSRGKASGGKTSGDQLPSGRTSSYPSSCDKTSHDQSSSGRLPGRPKPSSRISGGPRPWRAKAESTPSASRRQP